MITKAQLTSVKQLKNRESRDEQSLFVAEGEKIFEELVKSSLTISCVYYLADRVSDKTAEAIGHCENKGGVEVFRVTSKDMERMSQLKSPTPIIATVKIERNSFKYNEGALVLALDGVQDPGNMGTIIRLADWFGIDDIICSVECADVYNPKVVQASMGAVCRVRVSYLSLEEELKSLKNSGVNIYGTFLNGSNIYSKSIGGGAGVLVMGSEGRGISPAIEELITDRLFIPPYPVDSVGGESLNVAVATAIVCSEFRRVDI